MPIEQDLKYLTKYTTGTVPWLSRRLEIMDTKFYPGTNPHIIDMGGIFEDYNDGNYHVMLREGCGVCMLHPSCAVAVHAFMMSGHACIRYLLLSLRHKMLPFNMPNDTTFYHIPTPEVEVSHSNLIYVGYLKDYKEGDIDDFFSYVKSKYTYIDILPRIADNANVYQIFDYVFNNYPTLYATTSDKPWQQCNR